MNVELSEELKNTLIKLYQDQKEGSEKNLATANPIFLVRRHETEYIKIDVPYEIADDSEDLAFLYKGVAYATTDELVKECFGGESYYDWYNSSEDMCEFTKEDYLDKYIDDWSLLSVVYPNEYISPTPVYITWLYDDAVNYVRQHNEISNLRIFGAYGGEDNTVMVELRNQLMEIGKSLL